MRTTEWLGARLARCLALVSACVLPGLVSAEDLSFRNQQVVVTINPQDGSYAMRSASDGRLILRSIVAAQINHRWLKSSGYPKHEISKSVFEDRLGHGQQISIRSTGLSQSPDLVCILRQYAQLSFTDIEVEVQNRTTKAVRVQGIRSVEAIGDQPLNLAGPERHDRVMSDAEEMPPILDLGNAPAGLHLGIGSQLIYNTESRQSAFFGALTAERFMTMIHLQARGSVSDPHISMLTVDSTGTTEMLRQRSYVKYLPPDEQYDVNLYIAPGKSLASERLMFAAGSGYGAQLEAYGAAVRQLHRARVGARTMMGWVSDLVYGDDAITEGYARTNAQWMAEHLKKYGFNHVRVDAVKLAVPTDDVTSDASRFPHGMWGLTRQISQLGLNVGGWVDLLGIEETSFIYRQHKDWLVKNARGQPLWLVRKRPGGPPLNGYVLDATHPGAQKYLRRIFRTMVREWGWRQIDLDGITTWSIEGYRHRPNTTALEAYRIALQIVRETVGDQVRLHLNSGLWLSSVGFVDTASTAGEKFHTFFSTKLAGLAVAGHYYMDRNFFVNDPAPFCVQREVPPMDAVEGAVPGPLRLQSAQASIVLSALSPGARFAIGDDLPSLGVEPERLTLVTDPDLLQMVKLGRSAKPLDLMTYPPEDEQPGIFLLREDARQSMLAVFNWTERVRSHVFHLSDLGLASAHSYRLYNVLDRGRPIKLEGDAIRLDNQAAQSVMLVKIMDETLAPAAPTITTVAPERARIQQDVRFSAQTSEDSVPALAYKWEFGDGVIAEGPIQSHTYTKSGRYTVRLIVDGVDGIAAERNLQIIVDGLMELTLPRGNVYAEMM